MFLYNKREEVNVIMRQFFFPSFFFFLNTTFFLNVFVIERFGDKPYQALSYYKSSITQSVKIDACFGKLFL